MSEERKVAENKKGLSIPVIPLGTLLLAVAGALIGLWQYRDTANEQYRKEIWTSQKAVFEKVIAAASEIAVGESLESVSDSRQTFWHLYWGGMAMLETSPVEQAMIVFGGLLSYCEGSNNSADCFRQKKADLQQAALQLSVCARVALAKTWEPVDLGQLSKITSCPYS